MAYVLGLELQHPIVIIIWGHGSWPRILKKKDPPIVHKLRLMSGRTTWLSSHANWFVDIRTQSDPVKEACLDVQGILEPCRSGGV